MSRIKTNNRKLLKAKRVQAEQQKIHQDFKRLVEAGLTVLKQATEYPEQPSKEMYPCMAALLAVIEASFVSSQPMEKKRTTVIACLRAMYIYAKHGDILSKEQATNGIPGDESHQRQDAGGD